MKGRIRNKRILFRGGRFLDLRKKSAQKVDILVLEEGTRLLSPREPLSGALEIRVPGAVIFHGLVDLHTHLRSPGNGQDETLQTGARAALRGGVTTLLCMANTSPVNDSPEITRWILERSRSLGGPVILPVSSVTKGLEGRELVDFKVQKEAGAKAFSDDGKPIVDERLMREALQRAAEVQLPLISHCEDPLLSREGVMLEGKVSARLGVKGIPALAEENMVRRDLGLAAESGTPIHIAHVSTRGSVDAIREAKARGIQVTAETAPHFLCLTEEDCVGMNPDFKINPPLGTEEDQRALLQGLRDGTIDTLASDHAPHRSRRKAMGFERAPFGAIGMETLLPILLTAVVDRGALPLEEALQKVTLRPAEILRLEEEEEKLEDLVVVDTESMWMVQREKLVSKGKNCPFHGFVVRGKTLYTVAKGKVFAVH